MDHSWFFIKRIEYIRSFYRTAVHAFREQKIAIESGATPYDDPPYSEDGEPAFLDEWLDADASEDVLGRACISMLSDALKIYLNDTRQDDFRVEFSDQRALKNGFVRPHLEAFCSLLDVGLNDCPVDIDLFEQIVLARNRVQHGSILTTLDVDHDEKTLDRFTNPIFTDPSDIELDEQLGRTWYSTKLTVTESSLFSALDECAKLAKWLGPHFWGPTWSAKQ